MTVIAMTREMGTLGKEVARLLAERLETRLVYHELVEDQPDPGEMTGPSEVKRHLGNGAGNGAENGARSNSNGASHRNGRMTAVELLELASRGNVIIRGWGAVRLLHRIPHVFCLRVCAPMELRVAEMTRRLGVGERAARREIERSDGLHSGVFQRFFGGDWRDAVNYDLVVNTARITPADAADLVMDALPAFEESAESRQALADRLTEARVASFLAGDPATAGFARNVYVSVSGGSVSLYGSVRFEGSAREVADAVLARAGVSDVRNEIQTVGAYANA